MIVAVQISTKQICVFAFLNKPYDLDIVTNISDSPKPKLLYLPLMYPEEFLPSSDEPTLTQNTGYI